MTNLVLLGGFRLVINHPNPVFIPVKKARALLAFLAVQAGQFHSRDKLAALLWEDRSDAQARNSLRHALSSLRKALPDNGILLTDGDTVAVADAALTVDVRIFENLTQLKDPQSLTAAMELYQGEFLEGFDPKAPAFEDWLMTQRSYLQERMLALLSRLLDHHQNHGNDQQAIQLAQRLLILDPLREPVHRTLMILFSRQGQHSNALRQYRICREILRRELGVTPQPATEALYQQTARQRRNSDDVHQPSAGPVAGATAVAIINQDPMAQPENAAHDTFYGRRYERRQFSHMLEFCLETASGQALLIRGEAGIGKSWLLDEFTALAVRRGFACHRVQIPQYTIAPQQEPVQTLLYDLLALSRPLSAGQALTAAEQALTDTFIDSEQQILLNDLLGIAQPAELKPLADTIDAGSHRYGMRTLLIWLLEALSQQQPRLLVFEDIHRSDRMTLSYLARIAETAGHCPLLLLMSSRTEAEPADALWPGAMQGAALTTLNLGPLAEHEALALAAHYSVPVRFARRCVARAGGNPFFLNQLLMAGEHAEDIPVSVRDLVMERLQSMTAADKRALGVACVIGKPFSLQLLRDLSEQPGYDCTPLLEKHLIRPQGREYRVSQNLIRETVYTTMTVEQKRHWHSRAARHFQDRDAVLYAEHLELAEDAGAAVAYLAAARSQADTYRYERALDLLQRGLLVVGEPAAEFELTCYHGELLCQAGLIDAAGEELEQALLLAQNDRQRCRIWLAQALCLIGRERYREALALLDRAGCAAEGFADNGLREQIHRHRIDALRALGTQRAGR